MPGQHQWRRWPRRNLLHRRCGVHTTRLPVSTRFHPARTAGTAWLLQTWLALSPQPRQGTLVVDDLHGDVLSHINTSYMLNTLSALWFIVHPILFVKREILRCLIKNCLSTAQWTCLAMHDAVLELGETFNSLLYSARNTRILLTLSRTATRLETTQTAGNTMWTFKKYIAQFELRHSDCRGGQLRFHALLQACSRTHTYIFAQPSNLS